VIIQSFDTANLRELAGRTDIAIAQLINCSGAPYDLAAAGDDRTYADLATPAGLTDIATYADGIGVCKDGMIPRDPTGNLAQPTPVIDDAHAAGLTVHGWTFRRENRFLPTDFHSCTDLDAPGDMAGEIAVFLAAGMDGFFTDNPDLSAGVANAR
jgi:glycerophosphoryl diester phosphodiesterase